MTYEYLKENGLILFETVIGSQAYGTQTLTSDIDEKFVYILPEDNILGTKYVEQVNVTKDKTGWELKRFLELMGTSNPTVLELLNSPEDCIITKHPLFDLILENKDEFITKGCKNSFAGYAIQQIQKAKGLNKKQNWEKDKVARKDVLDFVYVIQDEKTIPLKKWMVDTELEIKFFGVVKMSNARDMYTLYYDWDAHKCFSNNISDEDKEKYKLILKELGKPFGLGYKGLAKVGGNEENPE